MDALTFDYAPAYSFNLDRWISPRPATAKPAISTGMGIGDGTGDGTGADRRGRALLPFHPPFAPYATALAVACCPRSLPRRAGLL